MRQYLLNDKKNKLKQLLLEIKRRRKSLNIYQLSSLDRIKMSVQRLFNELRFSINQKEWNSWVYKGLIAAGLITSSVAEAQQTPSFDAGTLIKANGSNAYLNGGRASLSVADFDNDGDVELIAAIRSPRSRIEAISMPILASLI